MLFFIHKKGIIANVIFVFLLLYLYQKLFFLKSAARDFILLFPFFIILSFNKYIRCVLLVLSVVLCSFLPNYFITNVSVIHPSIIDIVASTNIKESILFFYSLPIEYILYIICSICVFCVLFFFSKNFDIKNTKLKYFLAYALLLTIVDFDLHKDLFKNFYTQYKAIYSPTTRTPTWKIKERLHEKYDVHVLILGESCRADALSVYGCTLNTTPFLNSVPKKYIETFVSPSIHTAAAVPRMLALSSNEECYEENNIINIANQANINTYWISTQGFVGNFKVDISKNVNTPVSRIARFAKNKYFTRPYSDDMMLVQHFEKILQENSDRKLIVLHMSGSHNPPQHNLHGYPVKFKTGHGKFIDSYIATVNKMDFFVEKVYDILSKKKIRFSIIYTSDHGSNFIKSGNQYKEHRHDTKQSYRVPFIQIDYNYKNQEKYDILQSGFNIASYIPTWIGVTTNKTPDNYDIFLSKEESPLVLNYQKKLLPYLDKKDGYSLNQILESKD